ncbi:MAG: AMP-binding enzyme, partial [Acidimicrobiales bacterium]
GDMIISGGENVYPKEVELCLDSAPGIVESAVVGAEDDDLGEEVVAFIVASSALDLDLVRSHLQASLARFKHPRRYEVVQDLPRNAMGKVQKSQLRAQLHP